MSATIFISAGEASGEHYGALLAVALHRRLAEAGRTAQLFGMGGERMAAAGVERVARSEDMAVMGLTEVVLHLPRIYREFRRLKKAIRARRPDVAVLIDFPEIHFRLAREFHRLGVPVIFFVSPQLWAWKKHRIKLVQRYIRKMLVIFPFEEEFYRENGVKAEFVGHPLAELPLPSITREQFAAENNLDPERMWIGLLPGSRAREIRDHLPEMLDAARRLASRLLTLLRPSNSVVPQLPRPRPGSACRRRSQIVKDHGSGLPVQLVEDDAPGAASRASLGGGQRHGHGRGGAHRQSVCGGLPRVCADLRNRQRVVNVPHVAMANLIAGKRVVPELIQNDFTAAKIVEHIEPLLPDGVARESMMKELGTIRDALSLRPAIEATNNFDGSAGAIERVAAITLEELEASSPAAVRAPHRAESWSVLRLSTSEDGRREGSEYSTALASLWNKWASSGVMPR